MDRARQSAVPRYQSFPGNYMGPRQVIIPDMGSVGHTRQSLDVELPCDAGLVCGSDMRYTSLAPPRLGPYRHEHFSGPDSFLP